MRNDSSEIYTVEAENGGRAAIHLAGLRKYYIKQDKQDEIVPHLLQIIGNDNKNLIKIVHHETKTIIWKKQ